MRPTRNRGLVQVPRKGVAQTVEALPFSPLLLNPRNWFDASAITGKGDGNTITSWADLGSAAWPAEDFVAVPPVYKVNILNGATMPIVRFAISPVFTGKLLRLHLTAGGAAVTSFHTHPNTSAAGLSGLTVFVVATPSDVGTGVNCIYSNNANNGTPLSEIAHSRSGATWCASGCRNDSDFTQTVNGTSSAVNGRTDIVCGLFTFSAANLKVRVNGTQEASSVFQTAGVTTTTFSGEVRTMIGASTPTPGNVYRGDLAELMVFSSALSTDHAELIEGYLAWKWGLQSQLPALHPYKLAAPLAIDL